MRHEWAHLVGRSAVLRFLVSEVSWMRRLLILCLALCLFFCPGAEAAPVARGVFLSELLEARGLDWSSAKEKDGAAFILY